VFCSRCGKNIKNGAAFCSGCGAPASRVQPGVYNTGAAPAWSREGQPPEADPYAPVWPGSHVPPAGAGATGDFVHILPPPGDCGTDPFNPSVPVPASGDPAESAARAGYRLHKPGTSPRDTQSLAYSIVAMVLLLGITAGIPLYNYLAAGLGGVSPEGPIVDNENRYRIELPDDWLTVNDPVAKTGHADAVGYFFKGSSREPEVESIIYRGPSAKMFPETITVQMLEYIQPEMMKLNEMYMKSMGMEYELLESKFIEIDGRKAMWFDGNGVCEGCKPRRDFTFLAVGDRYMYLIKFLFEEERVDEFWPEIQGMLGSMEFF